MDYVSRELHACKMLGRPLQLLHRQAPSSLLMEPQTLVLIFRSDSDSDSLLALNNLGIGADDDRSRVLSLSGVESRRPM